MKIDVSERIEAAKRITREWAVRAGYKMPEPEPAEAVSDAVKNVRRVLKVSSFGCQERNVHALCEALLGERIPMPMKRPSADYLNREPFAVGSILVPAQNDPGGRAGLLVRTSARNNAGLRMSNGEMHNSYYQQHDLRPATDEEIDAYFSEFFGLSVNPADEPQVEGETVDELEPPF